MHHYDLYRLGGPEDMRNLELPDSFARGTHAKTAHSGHARRCTDAARRAAVTLVEWAERLGVLLPAARLEVRIADALGAGLATSPAAAEDDDDDDDDGGEDARPRTVTLQPHGSRAAATAAAVAAFVRAPPPGTPSLGGLALLP